jgi:hypothetical protein
MSSRVQQQQQAVDEATQKQQQSVYTDDAVSSSSTASTFNHNKQKGKKIKVTKQQSNINQTSAQVALATTDTSSLDECAVPKTDADTNIANDIQATPNSVYVCEVTGEVILYKTGIGIGLGLLSFNGASSFLNDNIQQQFEQSDSENDKMNTNICEQCGDATIIHRLLYRECASANSSVKHDTGCNLSHSDGLTLLSVYCCIQCKRFHTTLQNCCSDDCTDNIDDVSTSESSCIDTPVITSEVITDDTDSCSSIANCSDPTDAAITGSISTPLAMPSIIEHTEQHDTVLSNLSTSEYNVVEALILASKGDDIAAINIYDSPQKKR